MRYLIIGGDSFIGSALVSTLRAQCLFTTRRYGSKGIFFDLSNPNCAVFEKELSNLDVVIFAAGVTSIEGCEHNPKLSAMTNVIGTFEVLEFFITRGVYCIFLSSTSVFSSSNINPVENSETDPTSIYGCQKKAVEDRLLRLEYSNYSIVRLTKVWSYEKSIFQTWLTAIKSGKKATVFREYLVAPASINSVSLFLFRLAKARHNGILHLTLDTSVSYQELAESVFCQRLKLNFYEHFSVENPPSASAGAVNLSKVRPESYVCLLDEELRNIIGDL